MAGTPLLPFELVNASLLLVSDHLQAPADFLLLRILTQRLKNAQDPRRAVLVSFNHDAQRWHALGLKSGVSLKQYIGAGALALLDASNATSAAGVWELLKGTLAAEPADSPGLLILDGLNVLAWTGLPQHELTRLLRALYAHCAAANIALVVRHHAVGPPAERDANLADPLLRLLLQLCAWHVEVLPLASGRSGAVSGEIALHPGLTASRGAAAIPRSKAVQYRLTDSGVVFFERGNAGNVL